jgi:DNA-directed RNA polymerase specialized sigma24 family protein
MSDIDRLNHKELVAAYVAGDRGAFSGIYDRYASNVFSYALAMLHDRREAADVAHDTFLEAARRMGELPRPEKLRPWLLSIARVKTRANGREVSVPSVPSAGGDEDERGLRERVWAATDGLGERDQQLVALHLTEGLEGEDLALAMGVEASHVPVMVSRMSDRVAKALGPFVAARVEKGDVAGARRVLREVLPGIMIVPAPAALRARVLDKVDKGMLQASGPESESAAREVAPVVAAAEPEQTRADGSHEWVKYAAFLVVALVLGLVGFAVSDLFEPIEPPAAVLEPDGQPVAEGSTTTTTTRTTRTAPDTSSTATQPDEPSTTTSTQPSAPPEFEVSAETIDLGDEGIAGELEVRNTGGQPGQWQIASSSDAISLSTGQGGLGEGEAATIDLSLDREAIEEGDFSESLTISWEGGEVEVAVVGSHEANPIIHNPQASPSSVEVSGDSECQNTQTTISARIRDNSPIESVVVRWSPDGSQQQETSMNPVGSDMFEAVIGPFTAAQSASARIVAFDDRGNAGGATASVTVAECP